MEIFTFIQMGGRQAAIQVVPIGSEDHTLNTVLDGFKAFSGEKARCAEKDDEHRLLAVIEASFGDFVHFNETVRHVLDERRHLSITMATLPKAEEVHL